MGKLIVKTAAVTFSLLVAVALMLFGIVSLSAPAAMMELTDSLGMNGASAYYSVAVYDRSGDISDLAVAAALVPRGIDDYESLDSMPVRLVLLIAARSDQHAEYLRLLSRLSSKLKDDCFRERLFACSSSAEFYAQLIEK